MKTLISRVILAFLTLSFLMLGALAATGWYVHQPLPLNAPEIRFVVQRGDTVRQVSQTLVQAGVDSPAPLLYWLARLSGKANHIVAGTYQLQQGITPNQLISKLIIGDVTQEQIRFIEGWTFRQLRAVVENNHNLQQDSLGLSDKELLQLIGATQTHPEGLFFPDTYFFDQNSSALELFRRAYQAMQQKLDAAWTSKAPNLPLNTPYEALILASIIEKETGVTEERGLVASVFVNRLRVGMRLQTDPTVIYGLGDSFQGNLKRKHLQDDHDYNTYQRGGLPPTPIAMPSWASLQAAVNPLSSNYYYFVARGDGSSAFSRDLNEHNRAVARYQRRKGS